MSKVMFASCLHQAVATRRTIGPSHGLPVDELHVDERVLHYWRAHEGRGILTSKRLSLLGHPAPIHRPILWSVVLEDLTDLEVIEPSFPQASLPQTRVVDGRHAANLGMTMGFNYDALFLVRANETTVFSGGPSQAERVQRWINEARIARMVAVHGGVVPRSEAQSR